MIAAEFYDAIARLVRFDHPVLSDVVRYVRRCYYPLLRHLRFGATRDVATTRPSCTEVRVARAARNLASQ